MRATAAPPHTQCCGWCCCVQKQKRTYKEAVAAIWSTIRKRNDDDPMTKKSRGATNCTGKGWGGQRAAADGGGENEHILNVRKMVRFVRYICSRIRIAIAVHILYVCTLRSGYVFARWPNSVPFVLFFVVCIGMPKLLHFYPPYLRFFHIFSADVPGWCSFKPHVWRSYWFPCRIAMQNIHTIN